MKVTIEFDMNDDPELLPLIQRYQERKRTQDIINDGLINSEFEPGSAKADGEMKFSL